MASALYLTFSVKVENLVKNKLFICRDYHIQPDQIDKLPYYEYEMYLENIAEIQQKQEEEEKRQQKEREANGGMPTGFKMPSMPSMPKISLPKL